MNEQKNIGYGFCGSFCTLAQSVEQLRVLAARGYSMHPIMSEITYTTDTRFGSCADFIAEIEGICGRPILHTIPQVEPIGPKGYLDALIVAPCTGNTVGKLANGIYDTAITIIITPFPPIAANVGWMLWQPQPHWPKPSTATASMRI